MTRWILLAAFVATMALVTGCGDGVAYTWRERQHRADVIMENDLRQINDDWDMFMLNDGKTRMSRWTID